MKKKIVALGLVVALSVSSLTGCSFNSKTPVIGKIVGLGSSEMFKIDKEVCSKQEYMLVLMDTAGTYKADFGGKVDWNAKVSDNQTLQSYVMQKVKEDITVQYTLASMAKERNISLSTDESSMIKTKAAEYYKSLTSQEKEYTGASQENVENSVEKVENIVGKPGLFSQFRWKTQWKEWINPSEYTKSGYNLLF